MASRAAARTGRSVDRRDPDGGLEADGKLVEPGGDGLVPLRPVDATLGRVPDFAVLAIEGGRPAARASMSLAVLGLVGGFRDGAADPPLRR